MPSPPAATKKMFWIACCAFAVPTGFFSGWVAVLEINLNGLHLEEVDESVASRIGTLQIVAGCVAGLVAAVMRDRYFKKQLKAVICCM
jgi:hypothetical protein